MTEPQAEGVTDTERDDDRSQAGSWWQRRKGRRYPPLISLADGGVRRDRDVAESNEIVSLHYPVAAARLRELYLKSQYLLLPMAKAASCRSIEDDVLAVRAVADGQPRVEGVVRLSGESDVRASAVIGDRIARSERYITEHCETRALRSYSKGLVRATLYSAGVLLVIAVAGYFVLDFIYQGATAPAVRSALYQTLVAIGGGAAGATVSVLLRDVKSIGEIDDSSLARAAIIRVALGWFFAAAVVFLVRGEILSVIKAPAEGGFNIAQWFFWGGVGFLAGFNERWVRHLITRSPETKAPPAAKPKAPEEPPKPEGAPGSNGELAAVVLPAEEVPSQRVNP